MRSRMDRSMRPGHLIRQPAWPAWAGNRSWRAWPAARFRDLLCRHRGDHARHHGAGRSKFQPVIPAGRLRRPVPAGQHHHRPRLAHGRVSARTPAHRSGLHPGPRLVLAAGMAAVQHGSTATHPDVGGLAGTREDGDLHGWTRVDVLPPDGMQEVSGSSPLNSTRSTRSGHDLRPVRIHSKII